MLFGEGFICPKKPEPRSRPKPVPVDINNPCPKPYCWAHMGRHPNTNYNVRLMQYKQQLTSTENAYLEGERDRFKNDLITIKYDTHAETKRFQCQIKERLNIKLKQVEEDLEKRRKKLQELLANEEREFIGETIDKAQRGGDDRKNAMKERVEKLKAKREEERLAVVHQKRMDQYMARCLELRQATRKKNSMETKNTLLQQMRENEARREAIREEEHMWNEVMKKEVQTKMFREEQDLLDRHIKEKHNVEILDMQVRGKELLKEEEAKLAEEDRLEMERVKEQLRKEEIEELNAKIRKREQMTIELQEQLAMNERFMEQRKKEEHALESAFNTLVEIEIANEKAKIQDTTTQAKKEQAQYRAHLAQIQKDKKREEKELDALLDQYKQEILKKQEDAQCQVKKAKDDLLKNVLAGRAEQLEYKKREAEQQLRLKEAENELMRMACETNERLAKEYDRAKLQATKDYRQDLMKQIEYNDKLRERERQELERQLAEGMKEEIKYRKFIEDLVSGKIQAPTKHPFRRVLEKYDCHCPQTYSVKSPY